MDCSIKIGKSPECSVHSVDRRSIDEDELITIQYKIDTPAEIEQFGNIVTSKTENFYEANNSASKVYSCFLLIMIVSQ